MKEGRGYMEKTFRIISIISIFFIFFCLTTDINNLRVLKAKTKDSIDLATKAAVMQIDESPALISNGIFYIKEDKAKDAFLNVMALNLGSNIETIEKSIIEYKAINPEYSMQDGKVTYKVYDYVHPVSKSKYRINNPSFVASIKFKFNGLLIKKDIVISNNFGASQLVSK